MKLLRFVLSEFVKIFLRICFHICEIRFCVYEIIRIPVSKILVKYCYFSYIADRVKLLKNVVPKNAKIYENHFETLVSIIFIFNISINKASLFSVCGIQILKIACHTEERAPMATHSPCKCKL